MNNDNILDFFGLDPDKIRQSIEDSTKLEDDQAFFTELVRVTTSKKLVADALEAIEELEREAKARINVKAKALYGPDWQGIKGEKFKITRSKTGDFYLLGEGVSPKFVKVKKTPNARVIDEYMVLNGKLPKGVDLNDQRGESLRITVL